MATTTLSCNPEIVTVPANTNDHELNFDYVIGRNESFAVLRFESHIGGLVKINTLGPVDDSKSVSIEIDKPIEVEVQRGHTVHFKGSSGSETFKVTVVRK